MRCTIWPVLAIVIACHARNSFALSSVGRGRLATIVRDTSSQFAFLCYAKSGTMLTQDIGGDMASLIPGMVAHNANEFGNGGLHICPPNSISTYGNVNINSVLQTCSGMRAVFMIRRPTNYLRSVYIFWKNMDERTWDFRLEQNRVLQRELLARSLENGLKFACQHFAFGVARDMAATYAYVQNMTNVMVAKLEDFEDHYDDTTRTIFEFYLGHQDARIDAMVQKAAVHDLKRMSPEQTDVVNVQTPHHVADPNEKHEVEIAMTALYEAGDSCMQKLLHFGEQMGYGSHFQF